MKQITNDAIKAWLQGKNFSRQNTVVKDTSSDTKGMWLFASIIAENLGKEGYRISMKGYPSHTTKERLNGICSFFGIEERFRQRKGQQFFGKTPINRYDVVHFDAQGQITKIERL